MDARPSGKNQRFVLAAGMERSASTLLFNMLRLSLQTKFPWLISGWYGEVPTHLQYMTLLKTHRLIPLLRKEAGYIFFSYRDIRVAAVSHLRKFGQPITFNFVKHLAKECYIAKAAGATMFSYETLINEPEIVLAKILNTFDIQDVTWQQILGDVLRLSPPPVGDHWSRISLLHPNHFTFTHDNDWRMLIESDLQNRIHTELRQWFIDFGYAI